MITPPIRHSSEVNEPKGLGIRHLQSLLLMLAVFCGYLQRVNLSVTIVAMTNYNPDEQTVAPVFDWDNQIRAFVLSAFFLGYLVGNFPAALFGSYLRNEKLLLTITFTIGSIITIITPIVLVNLSFSGITNWEMMVAIRFLQGLIQAFLLPMVHGISARWAPPHERGTLIGFILSGIPLGTMATLAVSGYLSTVSDVGWPLVFYVSGLIGIIWVILWIILGANSPSVHSSISFSEREYINSSIRSDFTKHGNKRSLSEVPWSQILRSKEVWALTVAHTGHNWGFWLLLSEMPTFINAVFDINIKSDGLLSALPYLCMWTVQIPVTMLADKLNKLHLTSITVSRKIFNTIGMWGGSASLIMLGYFDRNADLVITLYVLVVVMGCCVNAGFNINHMDLSPNYAGLLMGISNGFASTGGLGAPLLVSYYVKNNESVEEWRKVFHAGAAILFISNLIFILCGSGKTQLWNDRSEVLRKCNESEMAKVGNTEDIQEFSVEAVAAKKTEKVNNY